MLWQKLCRWGCHVYPLIVLLGGPRFLINEEENGILVPVDDDDALADAIERVLNNEDLKEKLGKTRGIYLRGFLPIKYIICGRSSLYAQLIIRIDRIDD